MKKVLPSPLLSIAMFVLWLLLMQSLSVGNVLFGVGLAVFWPIVTAGLRPASVRVRRPLVLVRLVLRVLWEMLKSNYEVARGILFRRKENLLSGFMHVPLAISDRNALAALSMIITGTPGTAWAQLSADQRVLMIHVLEIKSEANLMKLIKERYEPALKEIFE